LLLLVAVTYFSSYRNAFIDYDDPEFVTGQEFIRRGVTWEGVVYAFTTQNTGNYFPLTWLSHMLDAQLFGLNAAGHHLVSVALHAANALLLFLVLARMTGATGASAAVAALFAVHPINIESVEWIAQRRTVLAMFFGLLAMGAYAQYAERPSVLRYVLVAVLLILGLLCKPILVTFPFLFLLLDYWPLDRWEQPGVRGAAPRSNARQLLLEKIPLLAIVIASSLITFRAQQAAKVSLADWPLSSRLANAVVAYAVYLRKLVFPIDLAVLYPLSPQGPAAWQVILSLLVLVSITAAVLWQIRERRYLAVGWFWFIGVLVPMIGVLQVGLQSLADRYAYLPAIGIFIMAVWGIAEASVSLPRREVVLPTLTAVVVVIAMIFSMTYVPLWRDNGTLFAWALEVDPDNAVAHYHVARSLVNQQSDLDLAATHLERAKELEPDEADIYAALGDLELLRSQPDRAIEEYDQAIKRDPGSEAAHLGRARVMIGRGKWEDARTDLLAVLRLGSDNLNAQYLMGLVLLRLNRFEEALQHLQSAINVDQRDAESHRLLGEAYVALRRYDQSRSEFERVLELRPKDALAMYQLGALAQYQHRLDEAVRHYRAALELDSQQLQSSNNLAWILATHPDAKYRDGKQAVALAEQICEKTKHERPSYLDTLSAALAEVGRFDEAVKAATRGANLAIGADQIDLAADMVRRQKLYESGQPYRDESLAVAPSPQ
jgi:tetratricopeptide (TPR) repeat protein